MAKTSSTTNFYFTKLWKRYENFIDGRIYFEKSNRNRIEIWKDKFLTQIVKFAIPIGIISLLLSFSIQYRNWNYSPILIDLFSFTSVMIIILQKWIPIRTKKYFGFSLMLSFAIVKILTFKSLMMGAIFLLLLSFLATLLFNKKTAYFSIVINALICTIFLIDLTNKSPVFTSGILNNNDPSKWLLYSINFMFVNLILVSVMVYIIATFETKIKELGCLNLKLRKQMEDKIATEVLLQESITHYKSLFFFNPLPILIYDLETLNILYLNKSAIKCYGYTKKEFIRMKVNQLSKADEVTFRNRSKRNYAFQKDKHFHRDGSCIIVDMNSSTIKLNGSFVRLSIISDITAETEHLRTIESKNEKMREIAYLQSHVIRSPLARILGIVRLMNIEPINDPEINKLLLYLTHSAEELDAVVVEIVKKTEEEVKKTYLTSAQNKHSQETIFR